MIPHDDPVIEKLIVHLYVKACYAGPETTLAFLRQRFWLTQGRREVKRVLRKCLTCKIKMAPLPAKKVQIAPPFRSTVSQSERKFRANYVKGLCVYSHLRRYSYSSSRIVEQHDDRRFSAGLSSYG